MSFFVPQVATRVAAQAPPRNPYGPPSAAIEPTPEYVQQLRSMTHHKDLLVKSGFIIAQLSLSDVEGKKRCRRCNARCNKGGNKYKGDAQDGKNGNRNPRQHSAASKPKPKPRSIPIVDLDDIQGDAKKDGDDRDDGKEDKDKKKPILKCRYHTGRVFNMVIPQFRRHFAP
ncbi:RNA exonuclease 3 [Colletotrichum sp. SAR 10_70]|nr:RNA exonuclease 3 [Colletotrichum sp. SAR 10_71]KAI8188373.1 RNA exonuclease 3 [Colletotrichum sp. SAR 10_75]KAI8202855.1 RNA exonuclease 3 [Colletotrichum sp. SAR 10_70]KAI8206569.1 RNA exonuclease 3 [Colletotrichum sp. SAR 10_65]KAI8214870.1 RNA exonuclease 3 [Colletotrichum sp. SAR 10_76]KAJ5007823.1 RNA exonuclease 3 [Colletotrichum sp. SAR 10_66]